MKQRYFTAVLIGAFVVLFTLILRFLPLFISFENRFSDFQTRILVKYKVHSSDISIIVIDEKSLQQMDKVVGRWPWPREYHGYMIDFLTSAGAKGIIYDVSFLEHDLKNKGSDQILFEKTKRSGIVFHSIFFNNTKVLDEEKIKTGLSKLNFSVPAFKSQNFDTFKNVTLPLEELREFSRGIGSINIEADEDGPHRRGILFARYKDKLYPSLPLSAYLAINNIKPDEVKAEKGKVFLKETAVPVDEEGRVLINFSGSRGSYPYYSASDIIYSYAQMQKGIKPLINQEIFKGKWVLIGTTAQGLFDLLATPFPEKMPGVEIHANILNMLNSGDFITKCSHKSAFLFILLFSVLTITAYYCFKPAYSASLSILVYILYFLAASLILHRFNYKLEIFSPLFSLIFTFASIATYRFMTESREKARVSKLFSSYVSKDVLAEILKHPETVRLSGTKREVTLLFSDIRNFTTYTEKNSPELVVEQLNDYFEKMVEVIFKNNGTVDKFIGDAVMAIFGAPADDEFHAESAVKAAVEMLDELDRLNEKWGKEGKPLFAIGIGINTGEAIIGNIGSTLKMNYTAIGDAVNLSSRIEGLTKKYNSAIIISEETKKKLASEYNFQYLDKVNVKGKEISVDIFSVSR